MLDNSVLIRYEQRGSLGKYALLTEVFVNMGLGFKCQQKGCVSVLGDRSVRFLQVWLLILIQGTHLFSSNEDSVCPE